MRSRSGTSSFSRELKRAYRAAALLTSLLLATSAAKAAPEWMARFIDPDDGQFDMSNWLLDAKGFLPVPVIITEPAVGYGAGVTALFFRNSMREVASQKADDGRLIPPDIYFHGAAATENGT